MGLRISGTKELQKHLKRAAQMEEVKRIVHTNGAELQRGAMRHAESAFNKGYSTGQTKRSISLSIKDGGLTAEISPGTDYSPYLEYGTRFMAAEPFMRPAYNEQIKKFKSELKELIR